MTCQPEERVDQGLETGAAPEPVEVMISEISDLTSANRSKRAAAGERHERRHLMRQEACREARLGAPRAGQRSGARWQHPQRSIERAARVRSVAFGRWASGHGLRRTEIAGLLRLPARTLRYWKLKWQQQRLQAPGVAAGRPVPRGPSAMPCGSCCR
jgi:hypothetical protein